MITAIIFILILGLLVFVHELGHFIMAKKMGMRVEEFGLGFPPRLFSIQGKETKYSINLIPLGGFVKITGEDGSNNDDPRSFASKKIWQRALVLIAGVTMNVILAYLILIIGFTNGLPHVLDSNLPAYAKVRDMSVQIIEVVPNSPAQKAELSPGDIILSIDGNNLEDADYLQNYIKDKNGQEVELQIKRGGSVFKKNIKPGHFEESEYPVLGVAISNTGIVSYPWYISIWEALKSTFILLWNILALFGILLYNLVTKGAVSADLSGPLGIAAMTGQVVNLGFIYLLRFVAVLSLNLAIINIIPFPALDGGKLFFLILEKFKGSPVNQKIENLIHNLGFMVLIVLIIVITYRDVLRFGSSFTKIFK